MKARLFLSYARSDGSKACAYFHDVLKNLGHDVYKDLEDNYGGDYWEQTIKSKIRRADALLLLVTPAAIASANVRREWQEALTLGKRIVPLLLSDVKVPEELGAYHTSDIRDDDERNKEPSKIHQGLEKANADLQAKLDEIRGTLMQVPEAQREYVTPALKDVALLLAGEPTTVPLEVLRTMCELAETLVSALAGGKDIGPLLNTMINGEFEPASQETTVIYSTWLDAVTRPLKKVRDAMPRISVPVIVVAMTDVEAEELRSGTAFAPWPSALENEFKAVAPKLDAKWTGRYGLRAEAWRPFGDKTVEQLVRDAFALVEGCRAPLEPSFVDVRTLRTNRKLLRTIRGRQCLVVIDCVSCRHPALYSAFRASHLDVSPRSVVVRTLADPSLSSLIDNVEVLVKEWLDTEFYHRHYTDDDPSCADVVNWEGFRKLLRNEIPRSLPDCAASGNERWNAINNVGRSGR